MVIYSGDPNTPVWRVACTDLLGAAFDWRKAADLGLTVLADGISTLTVIAVSGAATIELTERLSEVSSRHPSGYVALKRELAEGLANALSLLADWFAVTRHTDDRTAFDAEIALTTDRLKRFLNDLSANHGIASNTRTANSTGSANSLSPCKKCNQSIKNSDYVCPHCGNTLWGHIVGMGVLGIILLLVGIIVCDAGFWRWLWLILGGLFFLVALGEIYASLTWRKSK